MFEALADLFRYTGAGLLLTLAALLWRDQRDLLAARLFAPFAVAQSLEMLSGAPIADYTPASLRFVIEVITYHIPILLWWYTIAMFEDDFRPRRLEFAVAGAWFSLVLIDLFVPDGPTLLGIGDDYARMGLAGFISAIIAWRLFVGLRTDLIEKRRALRLFFAGGILFVFLMDIVSDVIFGNEWGPDWFWAAFFGIIALLVVAAFFWILRIDRTVLAFAPPTVETVKPAPDLSPAERRLKTQLDSAIADKVYLDPELSIGGLAARLGAPEHQVRALINRTLGHRNFRAFLNEHRLATAKTMLADLAQVRTPILTIAMDSGFASLAPFNRAFKEATGETPSAWREAALKGADIENDDWE